MDTIVKTSSSDVHSVSDPFLYNNLLTEDVPKLSIRRSNSMPTMMDWCYITTSLTHKQGLASPHRKKKSIEPLGSVSCHERMVSQEQQQEQQQEQEQEQEQQQQQQQHNLKQNQKQPRRKMPTPPSSTSTSMTEPESPFFGGLSRNIPRASNAQNDDDDDDRGSDRGVDVTRSSISDSPTATATIVSQPIYAASTLGSSTIPSASSSTSIRTRLLSDLQQAGSSSQTTIRRSQSRRTTTTTPSMRTDPGKQLRGLLFDLEQAGPYHPPTVPPNLPPAAGNTYPAYYEHMRNISKIAAIARGGSSSSSSLRQSSFGIRSSRSPGGESNSNNPNLPLSSSFLRNYDSNTTAGEGATAPPLPSPSSNSRNTMSSAPYSPNISNTDPASSIVRLVSDRDVLYRTSATLSRSMNEIPSINRAKRTYSNVGVVVGEKREDELQQLATIDDSTLIDVRRNKIRTRNMMLNNNGPMIKTKSASESTISPKESEKQHGGDQSNHNWAGDKALSHVRGLTVTSLQSFSPFPSSSLEEEDNSTTTGREGGPASVPSTSASFPSTAAAAETYSVDSDHDLVVTAVSTDDDNDGDNDNYSSKKNKERKSVLTGRKK